MASCDFNTIVSFIRDESHYGLFPLPEMDSDSDTDTDSCTRQNFSTGSDSDSDPLIEI